MIEAERISIRADHRTLIEDVSLRVLPGRVTVLLGPNGAGKSTVISALSGERKPDGGRVTIAGEDMKSLSPLTLARQRAVLLQNSSLDFAFTVAEVVNLGRLPFAGTNEALNDNDAVEAVSRIAGIEPLWNQLYQTLSGGERQRVQFARALAQIWRRDERETSRYLFLDEPTSALDLRHRHTILASARALTDEGVGIFAVLHDLNLTAEFADDVILMRDGHVQMSGLADQVLTSENIGACFDVPVEIVTRSNGRNAILA